MIRPCKTEDVDQVAAIANRAWREIHESYRKVYGEELFRHLYPAPETRVGDLVKAQIEKQPENALVVEEEGRIIGFLTYELDPEAKVGVIGRNAVDPECRRKGIGQQMYRHIMDLFRRRGMVYARVDTGLDEGHAPARRAYERAGFKIRWDSRHYYAKL